MPVYEYRCGCGNTMEAHRHVDERDEAPLCEACWELTRRVWSLPTLDSQSAPTRQT